MKSLWHPYWSIGHPERDKGENSYTKIQGKREPQPGSHVVKFTNQWQTRPKIQVSLHCQWVPGQYSRTSKGLKQPTEKPDCESRYQISTASITMIAMRIALNCHATSIATLKETMNIPSAHVTASAFGHQAGACFCNCVSPPSDTTQTLSIIYLKNGRMYFILQNEHTTNKWPLAENVHRTFNS